MNLNEERETIKSSKEKNQYLTKCFLFTEKAINHYYYYYYSNDTVLNPGGGEHINSTHELNSKDGSAITIPSEPSNDNFFDGQNMKLSGTSSLPDEDVCSHSDKKNDTELNESTVTLTKIECKSSDLSVTITPSEKSIVSTVAGEMVQNTSTFSVGPQNVVNPDKTTDERITEDDASQSEMVENDSKPKKTRSRYC